MSDSTNLVSAQWLLQHLDDADVKVIDGSWYLPQQGRNAVAEYKAGHIPGAVYFDLDGHSDKSSDLPHMMPSADAFAAAVSGLGISNSDHIVVYDGLGFMSAPRIWWMFKAFGHEKVSVLNGGMPAWKRADGPIEDQQTDVMTTSYQARLNEKYIASREDILTFVQNGDRQIVDARSADRFSGRAPEPREGLKSGHMPRAKNLPFQKLIGESGFFGSGSELRRAFEDTGLDLSRPIVTTCGSGVTAAILTLGLEELGHEDNKLYDGSWAEWGSHPETFDKIIG
ncbi:3-mercaptopyruvate sulfurtransferase [Pararhizobium sp. IMCC21322]|uniref:3-mercaptopyruvate sulfurtransferase n=1 Tax=Pararhizobium sp. IMCC21322 TaxID=3067903 RepID=UPI0027412B00|nr:3-mercaptopyruvate sulfurtransferase [Pararhizobium sp. IMCC21322]